MRRSFGTLFQRPARAGWYLRIAWHGERAERYGAATRALAGRKLAAVRVLVEAGSDLEAALAAVLGDAHDPGTFADALDPFLAEARSRREETTYRGYRSVANVLRRAPFARLPLARVRPRDVARWASARVASGVSWPTVNRNLSFGSCLYRWARRMGYARENPFLEVERGRENPSRETWLEADAARALVLAMDGPVRSYFTIAISTGMRRGELVALRWRSVDLARREIRVESRTAKRHRGRVLAMSADVRDELAALAALRPSPARDGSDRVFAGPGGRPLSWNLLYRGFRRALEASGIASRLGRVTPHDATRHTAATLMRLAGTPRSEIQEVLGHSTSRMTDRYCHAAEAVGKAALPTLGAVLALRPPSGGAGVGRGVCPEVSPKVEPKP